MHLKLIEPLRELFKVGKPFAEKRSPVSENSSVLDPPTSRIGIGRLQRSQTTYMFRERSSTHTVFSPVFEKLNTSSLVLKGAATKSQPEPQHTDGART